MSFLEETDEDEEGAPQRYDLVYSFLSFVFLSSFVFVLLPISVLIVISCNRVTFLFKVTRGAAKNSYGLNVARIADIPTTVSSILFLSFFFILFLLVFIFLFIYLLFSSFHHFIIYLFF